MYGIKDSPNKDHIEKSWTLFQIPHVHSTNILFLISLDGQLGYGLYWSQTVISILLAIVSAACAALLYGVHRCWCAGCVCQHRLVRDFVIDSFENYCGRSRTHISGASHAEFYSSRNSKSIITYGNG